MGSTLIMKTLLALLGSAKPLGEDGLGSAKPLGEDGLGSAKFGFF